MRKRRVVDTPVVPESWLPVLQNKVRPPVCMPLGSPRQVAEVAQTLDLKDAVNWQMDLYQAVRVQQAAAERGCPVKVVAAADLWDITDPFNTVLFPVEPRGERILKLDVVEQAYHLLAPQGVFIVLSRVEREQLFPTALKKIYGKVHAPEEGEAALLWCQRGADRPRRRHELTFHISGGDGPSFRFLSRPGVFSYGRFDNGARALMEIAEIQPGDRILDLGCGCGTNGVLAGRRAGADGHVTFVDSNLRATALAQHNAAENGLPSFDVQSRFDLDGLPPRSFDVVLTNPPYYAGLDIAQRFIEQAAPLLKKRGRCFLVTKQPDTVGPMMTEQFGPVEAVERRGYVILAARALR